METGQIITKDGKEYYQVLVPVNEPEQMVDIEGKGYILMPQERIKILLDRLEEHKADIKELKNCVVAILRLLGLLDENTGTIKESIKNGDESYFNHILKALSEVVALLGQAQIPIIGKKAEAKLVDKFHFVKSIIPLIEKHAGNGK